MMKPKERLYDPMTDEELAQVLQFRHITRYMVDCMPQMIQLPLRRVRT